MTTDNKGDVRTLRFKQYDDELKMLCNKLNPAFTIYSCYKERYAKMMDYYRVQLNRGLITKAQYRERAAMFVGYNDKKG